MSSSSEKVQFGDDVIAAYKFVHSDEQKGNAFAVIGYSNENTLTCIHKEADGTLDDIYAHFPADECRFALTKRVFQVEMAKAVKFIYLDWTPQGVKPARRAKLATHKRQAAEAAKPFHADFQLDDVKDLNEDQIQLKLGQISGVNKAQLNVAVTTKHEYGSKGATARAAENVAKKVEIKSTMKWENETDWKDHITKLRNGTDNLNWLLTRYSKKDTLQFIEAGAGGADELAQKFDSKSVEFALVKVVDVVDKSSTVKYAYIEWIGDEAPNMTKGYISSKKAEILHLFEPFTVKIDISSASELTQQGVEDKIKTLSGTKSSVLKKEEKKE